MTHDHSHGSPGRRVGRRRRVAITLGLVLTYMAAEVVGGFLSGSLALLADAAGHMFTDGA